MKRTVISFIAGSIVGSLSAYCTLFIAGSIINKKLY